MCAPSAKTVKFLVWILTGWNASSVTTHYVTQHLEVFKKMILLCLDPNTYLSLLCLISYCQPSPCHCLRSAPCKDGTTYMHDVQHLRREKLRCLSFSLVLLQGLPKGRLAAPQNHLQIFHHTPWTPITITQTGISSPHGLKNPRSYLGEL